jgi:predicted enzyme related to lactoylglutathione lyase
VLVAGSDAELVVGRGGGGETQADTTSEAKRTQIGRCICPCPCSIIDATLAAIERAGGTIEIPRTDVFGYGEFAHFRDPDGNLIGLWRD